MVQFVFHLKNRGEETYGKEVDVAQKKSCGERLKYPRLIELRGRILPVE
jgi:hypothetical protein